MTKFKPSENTLQNYLQNKLNETETEQVELWLPDHPDVMEDLELSLMLKEGISSLSFNNKLEKTDLENSDVKKYTWLIGWFGFPILASVALFVGYNLGQHGLSGDLKGGIVSIYGNALLVDIKTIRGEIRKPDAVIYLDSRKKPVVITMEVNSLSDKIAVAEILFAKEEKKIEADIEFSYQGIGSLFIGSENLKPGLLIINLRESNNAPIVRSLEFEIKYEAVE